MRNQSSHEAHPMIRVAATALFVAVVCLPPAA